MKIIIFFISIFVNLISFNLFAETDYACVRNSSNEITVAASSSEEIVTDIEGNTGQSCKEVPDFYKISIYKFALCTANPFATSTTDLSTCSYFINDDTGVDMEITYPSSSALPITALPAANTYKYAIMVLNSALKIKHSDIYSGSITGKTGSGKYCWTIDVATALSGNKTNGSVVSPDSSDTSTLAMDCGSAAGTAAYSTEYIDSFGENGETIVTEDTSGFALNGGTMYARLLQDDNATRATSYNNVERIIVSITFDTAKVVTSASSYTINFKVQRAVSVDLSSDGSTIWAIKNGADPFKIFIEVD
jgi:hypothetical protein